jgi:hypothetical protein
MDKPPRRFSLVESALVGGVINLLLNGGFGWLAVPVGTRLPMLGVPGVLVDMVAMAFGIAFGTAIGVTPLTRKAYRDGKLLPPELSPRMERLLEGWPRPLFRRSVLIGVVGLALFAPPVLVALWMLGVESLDRLSFVELKGGWAFVAGAFVSPPIAVAALLDAQADAAATTSDQRAARADALPGR